MGHSCCKNQADAELTFLREVSESGGNGVVNQQIRRHKGGFISIQGDDVVLEKQVKKPRSNSLPAQP
jgi:hypothetical protein